MEIERKWLVYPAAIPYDLNTLHFIRIRQAYISFSPSVRIRQINNGEKNLLTVKRQTAYPGLANEESEYEVDSDLAAFLFSCTSGNIIIKTRYLNPLPSGLTGGFLRMLQKIFAIKTVLLPDSVFRKLLFDSTAAAAFQLSWQKMLPAL